MKNIVCVIAMISSIAVGCKSEKSDVTKPETRIENFQKKQLDCNDLPEYFSSFDEAEEIVRNAEYIFSDELNDLDSEWITHAEYYSCDGEIGYFIMCTLKSGCYIFDDMENEVWNGFKNADDYGKYYHEVIKGKYGMKDRIR